VKTLLKILYGLFFALLFPLFLAWWSSVVVVPFPAIHLPAAGFSCAGVGLMILLVGMWTLTRKGEGLPMNAFPPSKLVTQGIYRVLPHPIYFGFVVACLGGSVGFGSATGLWLTTPLALILCGTLVIGYERPFLLAKHHALPKPILRFGLLWGPLASLLRLNVLWNAVLRFSEKVANSWRFRRIGRLRIINHGIYGGLAGGVGAFLTVWLSGGHVLSISIILMAGLIGAGIWAQVLEGSSVLLRPFGYYGGVLGIALGTLGVWWFDPSVWLILGAFAFAGPWIQGIGRIRCLIQGCCHGRLASQTAGIKVTNPHSRVCALDHLHDRPIYPTQLYSILGNVVIGLFLIWLWLVQAPLTLIVGSYLILSGCARFMEEAYRGEPQTRRMFCLPIYQWLAIGCVLAGMLVMTANAGPAPGIGASSLVLACMTGGSFLLVCWFALGMDFPESKVMFSRLSD
jgi:phosphatidylglycerol:prolipoprotein diacylglycerol transferase